MFEEFKNKVLFVTGAASGMGRAVAVRFGGLGCKVAVAARRPDAGAETVRLVKEAGGIVCGEATILVEGDADEKLPELIHLGKIPLFDKDANVIGENPNPTAYVK